MSKYRKRPIEVEAFRWGIEIWPEWFTTATQSIPPTVTFTTPNKTCTNCKIHTLEGVMEAHHGDYIIRGIQGEIYPCRKDIFEETYEEIEEE